MKNKIKKLILFTTPIIVLIEIYLLTLCAEMIRKKSDTMKYKNTSNEILIELNSSNKCNFFRGEDK